MIETMAKHMLVLKDSAFNEIINFLDAAEIHGKSIKTSVNPLEENTENKNVAYEARLIKKMMLRLR